jgi:uncharacterized repeat protein (TIGR03803 family)
VKGNLYGTNTFRGLCSGGAAFELSPGSNDQWTSTLLWSFGCKYGGIYPAGTLIFDNSGNLYGTAVDGGSGRRGTVFELVHQQDGTWTAVVLHRFAGPDGANPECTLVFDSHGNLIGTTTAGGASGLGTVFMLTPASGGGWTEKILHSFTGGTDGASPDSGVILDGTGNLYGTTTTGGAATAGTVYEITP